MGTTNAYIRYFLTLIIKVEVKHQSSGAMPEWQSLSLPLYYSS